MPYKVSFRDSDGRLETNYYGVLNDEDFLKCANEKEAIEDLATRFKISISDFSAVSEFKLSIEIVKESAFRTKQFFDQYDDRPMLVVLPTDLQFGMGRLWSAFAGSDDKVKMFRTRDEADAWLMGNVSKCEKKSMESSL
ncbi:MAG: hypothetical protein COC19_04910 [SAR86 cluster bacterium]|uniref:STAS/SEC14 domain-containing protein n=1 Tax=SAR86 cluster bacterium TaxID=2030880 RepID=A0A2A4MN36_9GAMM|nr:MAG: hypothetical protein COC19_04910 [SAR86 cluster bacterium]